MSFADSNYLNDYSGNSNFDNKVTDDEGIMNEGFADYFAAVNLNYHKRYHWRDLENDFRYDRPIVVNSYTEANNMGLNWSSLNEKRFWVLDDDLFSDIKEENDYGWVHHNSLAFSGALWDYRNSYGVVQSLSDENVFNLINDKAPKTFHQALNDLIALDPNFERQIRNAFARHGIYNDEDSLEENSDGTHNDSWQSAKDVSATSSLPNMRGYDPDWYRIYSSAGQLKLTFSHDSNYGQLVLEVWDGNHSQQLPLDSQNGDEYFYNLPNTGYYLIHVKGQGDNWVDWTDVNNGGNFSSGPANIYGICQ